MAIVHEDCDSECYTPRSEGARGSVVVKTLRYKQEGSGFESR
jgi:hypothetical protein